LGGLKKSDILRGHGRFRSVITKGQRVEGTILRCYVLKNPQLSGDVQFGIIVPSKHYRATRRNRLKRLIRESIAARHSEWIAMYAQRSLKYDVIVYYKGSDTLIPEKIRLKDIDDDLERIRNIISRKKL